MARRRSTRRHRQSGDLCALGDGGTGRFRCPPHGSTRVLRNARPAEAPIMTRPSARREGACARRVHPTAALAVMAMTASARTMGRIHAAARARFSLMRHARRRCPSLSGPSCARAHRCALRPTHPTPVGCAGCDHRRARRVCSAGRRPTHARVTAADVPRGQARPDGGLCAIRTARPPTPSARDSTDDGDLRPAAQAAARRKGTKGGDPPRAQQRAGRTTTAWHHHDDGGDNEQKRTTWTGT